MKNSCTAIQHPGLPAIAAAASARAAHVPAGDVLLGRATPSAIPSALRPPRYSRKRARPPPWVLLPATTRGSPRYFSTEREPWPWLPLSSTRRTTSSSRARSQFHHYCSFLCLDIYRYSERCITIYNLLVHDLADSCFLFVRLSQDKEIIDSNLSVSV